MNVITDGGDTHVSLNKVKDAKVVARDLRLRFELGGPAAQECKIGIAVLWRRIGDNRTRGTFLLPSKSPEPGGARAKVAWRSAATRSCAGSTWCCTTAIEREFDLAALEEAIIGFVFSVGPHEAVTQRFEDGSLSLSCDGLSVSAEVKSHTRARHEQSLLESRSHEPSHPDHEHNHRSHPELSVGRGSIGKDGYKP